MDKVFLFRFVLFVSELKWKAPSFGISSKILWVYFSKPLGDQEPLELIWPAATKMSSKGSNTPRNANYSLGLGVTISESGGWVAGTWWGERYECGSERGKETLSVQEAGVHGVKQQTNRMWSVREPCHWIPQQHRIYTVKNLSCKLTRLRKNSVKGLGLGVTSL